MPTIAEMNAKLTLNAQGFITGVSNASKTLDRELDRMEKRMLKNGDRQGLLFGTPTVSKMKQIKETYTEAMLASMGDPAAIAKAQANFQKAAGYSTSDKVMSADRAKLLGEIESTGKAVAEASKPPAGAGGTAWAFGFNDHVLKSAMKLYGVSLAMRAGMSAVQGISAAWRGDWEKVDQLAESLPAGLGAIYGSMKALAFELSGVNAEIAKMADLEKEAADEGKALSEASAVVQVFKGQYGRGLLDEQRKRAGFSAEGNVLKTADVGFANEVADVWSDMYKRLDELAVQGYDADSKQAQYIADETQKIIFSKMETWTQRRAQLHKKELDDRRQAEIEAMDDIQAEEADRNREYQDAKDQEHAARMSRLDAINAGILSDVASEFTRHSQTKSPVLESWTLSGRANRPAESMTPGESQIKKVLEQKLKAQLKANDLSQSILRVMRGDTGVQLIKAKGFK
jgi:hypothetical protein